MWNILWSWPTIGFVVSILIAVGFRMNSTSFELLISRIFFSFAALIAAAKIGTWLMSIDYLGWKRIGLVALAFGIIGLGWASAWFWADSRELMMTSGIITPDNQPTPPNPCQRLSIPDNAILLLFGNSASFTTKVPHTVIQVANKPILVINKHDNTMTLSGKFFSKDGRIIAELRDNKFVVNLNNYFRIVRPNYHKLIVYDQEGNEALNVTFINPSVIKFLGRFYLPNRPPIIINENSQIFGGMTMSHCGFGENRVDIVIR